MGLLSLFYYEVILSKEKFSHYIKNVKKRSVLIFHYKGFNSKEVFVLIIKLILPLQDENMYKMRKVIALVNNRLPFLTD